ncbi:unnamed protein product [Rotaria sp. Silwood2]|nr:unnamed protein product [Rotaria sp. Silwood2]CAF3067128.1 unnamed protein product [Rotaria sp. Silwood2]CAF3393299.1 unnamed protein product [Rotaria sp. Silwood2]CAF4085390.1 unnamed protein product [Rotaria sp. Silwood2]
MIELLDLPNELILAIMNKVKPRVLLLCSIIGIGNNRLEQLAIDKCHSIDLTLDYPQSPHEQLMKRFYSHVLPYIYKNIQSLALTLHHLSDISTFAEEYCDGTFSNLTHLKIILPRQSRITDTNFTLVNYKNYNKTDNHILLGSNMISSMHSRCLFSVLPQLYSIEMMEPSLTVSAFRCSRFMRSIISFEFDEYCILPTLVNNDDLFFPQSSRLTHIRITLLFLDNCIDLLNQLGAQLHSFAMSLVQPGLRRDSNAISRIASISSPYLKELTITSYRNIPQYERYIVPLLQRLSTIKYLTLLLAIGVERFQPHHFIDGYNLQRDIISHMPHLRQFYFHIRSIVVSVPHIDIDTIRQSFFHQEQSVDCVLDYFNNECGQCQIFSLPFIGTRLDFISNRFPLFDENKNTFSNVTTILLFDDVKPFEHNFFVLVSQALPHLKSLEVFNRLEQQEKTITRVNEDHGKILFTDEKYFSLEGVFNRQNECVYAVSREEADKQGGIKHQAKYPKRIMVWLGASKNGLTSPIIFTPGETLSHKNYIEVVLPHAQSEGSRLLDDDFIFQQDNATPHIHNESLAWCEENFAQFINNRRWPPHSPDLNVLDYYVWDAITNNMQWSKIKNYDSLIDEIEKAIRRVPINDLARSVENWSQRILSIFKNKRCLYKINYSL